MKIKNIIWILVILFLVSIVNAQLQFYQGNVIVERVNSIIDLEDKVYVDYIFSSPIAEDVIFDIDSDVEVTVDGVLAELPVKLSFERGQKKTVSIVYELSILDGVVKEVDYNPKFSLNGLAYPSQAFFWNLEVVLPSGINNLINPPDGYTKAMIEGNVNYIWDVENVYLKSFKFVWSEVDADIGLVKEVSMEADSVKVDLTIQNRGTSALDNILLRDVFFPVRYSGLSPLDEFQLIEPFEDENVIDDGELIWSKTLGLDVGEVRRLSYSILDNEPSSDLVFNPTTVFVDGVLISTSNQVIIEVEEDILRELAEESDQKPVSPYDIVDEEYEEEKDIEVEIPGDEIFEEESIEPSEKSYLAYILVFGFLLLVILVVIILFRRRSTHVIKEMIVEKPIVKKKIYSNNKSSSPKKKDVAEQILEGAKIFKK